MIEKLYDKLSQKNKTNMLLINDFSSHYLYNKNSVIKFNSNYYIFCDDDLPRYCDINMIYITTNFYLYNKYKNIMSIRFLPYNLNFKNSTNLIKMNKNLYYTKETEFDSWRTICYNKDTFTLKSNSILINKNVYDYAIKNNISINKLANQKFYREIIFNIIDGFSIYDLIYTIAYSHKIKINDYSLRYTKNYDLINELVNWLDTTFIDNTIDTENINIDNYNKLINMNEKYVMDYIFGTNNIVYNSYIDFLNSEIW